jgi:hypothetical protein
VSGATGQQLVDAARSYLGTPYVWGGTSRSGIDCSGLVQAVYAAYGINLPRVTYQQIGVGDSVPVNKLQPGDLVFFDTDKSKKGPDHVGIYIGGGKFIHAPKTGDQVKISSLTDSYYMNRWMGGRRVSGVTSSGDVPGLTSDAAPEVKLSASELSERYGMSYAFFKSQPELYKQLQAAVSGQWTAEKFQAEVKNTKWWKENSSSARKAQVLAKSDPATYKANLAAAQVAAAQAAVGLGAILTSKQVNELAKNMVTYDWNAQQVANYLGKYVEFSKNHTLGGQAATAAKEITATAYNNGIKLSDETVKTQAAYLTRSLTSMEKIQSGLREQAMGSYPGWAEQIAAGANVRDLASPYIQMTAQELGLPETDIDLTHPKVQAAIKQADSKGQPSPMSLSDYRTQLRSDPAWRRTDGAASTMMTIGRQVLADMGLVK